MSKLDPVTIRGYRSVRDATPKLRPVNVSIGANGAGKSNLVAFFKMMNELMAGRLQQHVGSTGRATSNPYFGPRTTPRRAVPGSRRRDPREAPGVMTAEGRTW